MEPDPARHLVLLFVLATLGCSVGVVDMGGEECAAISAATATYPRVGISLPGTV